MGFAFGKPKTTLTSTTAPATVKLLSAAGLGQSMLNKSHQNTRNEKALLPDKISRVRFLSMDIDEQRLHPLLVRVEMPRDANLGIGGENETRLELKLVNLLKSVRIEEISGAFGVNKEVVCFVDIDSFDLARVAFFCNK